MQAGGQLFRILRRIARKLERFTRQDPGGLVMLAAALSRRVHAEHDVGANHSNEAHEIADDLVPAPLLERLLDAERIAEVDGAREVLLGAVEAVKGGELLGPEHAKRLENFRTDFVLAAVAASRSRQRGAVALSTIQLHEQSVVLIVGMSRGHHQNARIGEVSQRKPERDVPLLIVERHDAHLTEGAQPERCHQTDSHCELDRRSAEPDRLHDVILPERGGAINHVPGSPRRRPHTSG